MDITIERLLSRKVAFDVKHYLEGISRTRTKTGFIYYYIKNNKQVSKKDLERILKLKIPPGWENVWISPHPSSPIQAIGIDVKGKKQYKYHHRTLQTY